MPQLLFVPSVILQHYIKRKRYVIENEADDSMNVNGC
jgi:hypothetical protein